MKNLLDIWRSDCLIKTSNLNVIDKYFFSKSDIDIVYNYLLNFFGSDFFLNPDLRDNHKCEINWFHHLLVNSKKTASIIAIFEIAILLKYLIEKQSKKKQRRLESMFKNPRQLRDAFFELYISYLLQFNNIPISIDSSIQGKEIDIIGRIDGIDFIGECKKIYSINHNFLNTINNLKEIFRSKLSKNYYKNGLTITIKFTNINDEENEKNITRKLDDLLSLKNFNSYKDNEGELNVYDFNENENIQFILNSNEYHIVCQIVPNINSHTLNFMSSIDISIYSIKQKVKSVITNKIEQHSKSPNIQKIYFFDNEITPDLQMPVIPDPLLIKNEIENFINEIEGNDIFCFISRNYTGDFPIVSIDVYGNNVNLNIKKRLQELNTNFSYIIRNR